MTKTTHAIIQGIAVAMQIAQLLSSAVPADWKPVIAAAIGLIQASVALYNHKHPAK